MSINSKTIIRAALMLLFMLGAYYNVSINYEPLQKLYAQGDEDTTGDTTMTESSEEGPNTGKDVSQMFNERGFYTSNGTSYDENEMINDFNGNLMYEIPLYNFKGSGEINCDVKLVYNGSVNHQIVFMDSLKYTQAGVFTKYNMNFPEWIINVNGFAVQVMNFETKFLTEPLNNSELKDHNLKCLIPGYHFDDNIMEAGKDKINILMGDGSLLTLINKSEGDHDSLDYSGSYYADGKGSHIKANVYFSESGYDYKYMNRVVEVSMGDGLIYVFREYKRTYESISSSTVSVTARMPQILMLEEIKDRFGHKTFCNYGSSSPVGRELLTGIGGGDGITVEYYFNGIIIRNSSVGNYKIHFGDFITYERGGLKRPGISAVTNPALQQMTFKYDNDYTRKLNNVPYLLTAPRKIILTPVTAKRIVESTNFLGGKRLYSYVGNGQLSIDYPTTLSGLGTIRSESSNEYKGYGRDAFFTNMVSQKISKDETGAEKSKETFIYGWTPRVTPWHPDNAIDSGDAYTTERKTESLDGSTVNNSNILSSVKEYRVYKVRDYGTFNPDHIDVTAVTKIIKDVSFDANNSVYSKTDYVYERGTVSDNMCKGSFLLLTKADTTQGLGRFWNYMYSYKDDGAENKYDSVVTQKIEVDPNGFKTQVFYNNFDTLINFIQYGMQGVSYGYNPPDVTYWGMKRYFKTGVDTLTRRFNNNGNRFQIPSYTGYSDELLQQASSVYMLDTGSTSAYYGQKLKERTYAAKSTSAFIQTDFQYYRKDTLGRFLYSPAQFPNVEGNLKLVSKPGGQEEKYFYYLFTRTDTAGDYSPMAPGGAPAPPKLWFKIKYNNGSEVLDSQTFKDERLPTRIDNYLRNSDNSRDTLKVIYMDYTLSGKPYWMVDEQGYLTKFDYDNTYNRISKITLPGDFTTTADRDTLIIDTTRYYEVMTMDAIGVGAYNTNPDPHEGGYGKTNCASNLNSFTFKHDMGASVNKYRPYIKFDSLDMNKFAHIDSAVLSLAPQWYTLRSGGISVPGGYNFTIKPVSGIFNPNIGACSGTDYNLTIENYYAVNAPFSSSLFRNYLPDSVNRPCETPQPHNIRVEGTLNPLIINNKDLRGFIVDYTVTGISLMEASDIQVRMPFTDCPGFSGSEWLDNYIPRLTIYGVRQIIDTIHAKIHNGGTYVYQYDDKKKTTTVKSRMNNGTTEGSFKHVRYHFNGFGNIKRKDIFDSTQTGHQSFDSLVYKFNFLGKPARNFDGTGDTTMFSYDFLGRPVKSKNADVSYSTTAYTYQSSLYGHLMGYTGFVEKQSFTDETGRTFNKYFDAVGNLLREEKFVAGDGNGNPAYEDNPHDPDTTFESQDAPGEPVALITDYQYDNLYRLIKVRTPGEKIIEYAYDAYGRQSQRMTPDASYTKYTYDALGNLIFTQDAKQRAANNGLWTARTYDAMNRLLTIGEVNKAQLPRDEDAGGSNNTENLDTISPVVMMTTEQVSTDSLYIINVYDTIAATPYGSVFENKLPQDYSGANFSRGKLVATAFRTNLPDAWSFKFYRYDVRGNVTKFWQKLAGMDSMKTMEYKYNGQSQVTSLYYQYMKTGWKYYAWVYDDAGRMRDAGLLTFNGNFGINNDEDNGPEVPDEETQMQNPGSGPQFKPFAQYTYTRDQQVDTFKLNDNAYRVRHIYNNRNWLYNIFESEHIFKYTLLYNPNGNIRKQIATGAYNNSFADYSDPTFAYIYDNSNRLVKTDRDSGSVGKHDLIMGYDKDGNLKGLKRYGATGNVIDTFGYEYYTGNNRLKKVSLGAAEQFYYDANGNIIADSLNHLFGFKYDWRNLITEFRRFQQVSGGDNEQAPEDTTQGGSGLESGPAPTFYVYGTYYSYDEAGNRTCKRTYVWVDSRGDPSPVEDITEPDEESQLESPTGSWLLQEAIYYVRDIGGREIAIYNSNTVEQWNLWGADNVGSVQANGDKRFYLKDHLGTVRCVLDSTNTVIEANDYDAWGYPLEDRSFSNITDRYKFTGKERDKESGSGTDGCDYFGARYYSSRIGRWGQMDPLKNNSISLSPYQYSRLNPINFFDPNGKDEIQIIFRTYIPQSYSVSPKGVVFHDGRGPEYSTNRYRTEQSIIVETDMKGNSSDLIGNSSDIGTTYAVEFQPFLTVTENHGEGRFSLSPVERLSENSVKFSITGEAHETLVEPFFDIDYYATFNISKNEDGTFSISVKGKEDGFPAYEIWVKNLTTDKEEKLIYDKGVERIEEIYKLAPGTGDRNIDINTDY